MSIVPLEPGSHQSRRLISESRLRVSASVSAESEQEVTKKKEERRKKKEERNLKRVHNVNFIIKKIVTLF